MKLLFIALAYFALGFVFPGLPIAAKILVALTGLFMTLYVLFNLFDDRSDESLFPY